MYLQIDSVLLTAENFIDLNYVLKCAMEGGVMIRFVTQDEKNVEAWLKSLGEHVAYEWETVVKASIKAESKYRGLDKIMVNVVGNPSVWNTDPPRLNMKDAAKLAGQQKRIILENSRADSSFMLSMADKALREKIQNLLDSGRLAFHHGGGNTELLKQLEETHLKLNGSRFFCWVLIDSDSPKPGQIGDDAKAVIDLCSRFGVRYVCLKRRAIENYLPRTTLFTALDNKELDSTLKPKFEAFFKLNKEQRHHFHMKKGLGNKSCAASGLYDEKADPNVKIIKAGFGDDLGSLYKPGGDFFQTLHAQLAADGATEELKQPFFNLKSMMRGLQ
jgi:hypothetical protein